jgi:hypothetical protein
MIYQLFGQQGRISTFLMFWMTPVLIFLYDGWTPEPALVTYIQRWMEKWFDPTARTTKLLSFLL